MASFKSNPIFFSTLIVIGAVALGEGWCIFDRSQAAKKSYALLVKKRGELAALEGINPFPNATNKAAVEADLLRTQAALATMREELKGRGPTAEQLRNAKVPAEPTDIFFDLANFVEKSRDEAKKAGVRIKADERFGFSAYASAGPEREMIPQVFRQRQIAQYLLEALFAAKPAELVSLQRERPLIPAQQTAVSVGQSIPASAAVSDPSGPNADLFEIDPRISARVPGFVNATAFRLAFIGETESLRTLLNKLAAFELPLVVRSVEVEPASISTATTDSASAANSLNSIFGNTAVPADASSAAPAKPKPLVAKIPSKFIVTVESIDLVTATPNQAAPTP